MIREHAAKTSEATVKQVLGVKHWVHDKNWVDSLMLLESRPTINIEGLVGGYTGPGGKTVLPHKAVAKIDMRLVPDMTAADTLGQAAGASGQARIRRHRSQHERRLRPDANRSGQQTDQTQLATYRKLGVDPQLWPRSAGSWPGYVFTGRAVENAGRAFRIGSRHGRACAGRILFDRIDQSQGAGTRRRGGIVRRLPVCASLDAAVRGRDY